MHYIYTITNLINNKVYVGQTKNISKRWSDHRAAFKNNKPTQRIHYAMIKYGIVNFSFEIVASCLDQAAANEAEEKIINQFESYSSGRGYNLSLGGSVAPKTEEWKDKMRQHWSDPLYKEKFIKSMKETLSKRTSEEQEIINKKILSTKSNYTEEQKIEINKKIAATLTGVKHTKERKANISKSHLGQKAWNKDTKGIMKPNKTSFKKDHIPYNKGTNITNSGSFKVGHKPLYINTKPNSGSFSKGENHKNCKLTENLVLQIIELYKTNNYTQVQLAKQFNVSRGSIKAIISGRNWNHITKIL